MRKNEIKLIVGRNSIMVYVKYLIKIIDINKFYLENIINEGDIVIDVIMGNGYDIRYLVEKVGEKGFVYVFDI